MVEEIEKNSYFKLWWLFIETSHFAGKARNTELSRYGITMEQTGILFCLKSLGDNVTSAELGRQRGRERNTMSQALDKMVRQGLIKKTKEKDNKHLIRIKMTNKGRNIIEKYDQQDTMKNIFSDLSKDELILLQKLLLKVHEKSLCINKMDDAKKRPLEFLKITDL